MKKKNLFTKLNEITKKHAGPAFSLVELMISLITISLVAAAFAPVITKKLKSSTVTIGTEEIKAECSAFGAYCELCYENKCIICNKTCTDDEIVNTKQCECASCASLFNDQCLDCNIENCTKCTNANYITNGKCTPCEAGYYCDGITKTICPQGYYCSNGIKTECPEGTYSIEGASNCSSSTTVTNCKTYSTTEDKCVACATNYVLEDNKCTASFSCTTAKGLLKITVNLDGTGAKTYCITQYNIGDHDNYRLPATNSTYLYGIYQAGSGDSACSANNTTGCCWQGKTAGAGGCDSANGPYSGCKRTVCNWHTANGLCENLNILGTTGWRLPTRNELENLNPDTYSKTTSSYPGRKGLMFCEANSDKGSAQCFDFNGSCLGAYYNSCEMDNILSGTPSYHEPDRILSLVLNWGNWMLSASYYTGAASVRCIKEL